MPRPTDAEVITAEARRPAEHPDALDYILRGRSAYNHWPIRDNYAQPVRLFEQALALNPRSVEAQTWMDEKAQSAEAGTSTRHTFGCVVVGARGHKYR